MPEPARPSPDAILAHVQVLRITDRLLEVADELREARDHLQLLLDQPPATNANEGEGACRG
jgi:hypothetical protein